MISENLLKNEELAVYRLRSLYSGYGYMQYKMSKFEEYDLYVKNKDFLISDRVITFTDTNGKLLALKPDVTLSIINNLGKSIEGVHKMYYNENVYRVSGATGKFKEIMQTGLECIGNIGIYETAEVLYLAIKSLELIDSDFRLELSHASLLNEMMQTNGITDNTAKAVLEAISVKSSGIVQELYKKGDITKEQFELISVLCTNFNDLELFEDKMTPFIKNDICRQLFDEFISVVKCVYSEERVGKITVNFSLSSDAGYYSGIVFKGFINGIPTSVLSGGQYDKLMKKLGNKGGAVGFAVYLDSFERFGKNSDEYDVDVVLIAAENDLPQNIIKTAEKIRLSGESVLVCSEIPSDLRFRRTVRMEEHYGIY